MKKLLIIIFLIMIMFFSSRAEKNIAKFEGEVKGVLKTVSPSLVKVVSQNHKKYIATGIAIDRDYVITNLIIVRHPYESIYVSTAAGDRYPARITGKDNESSIMLLKIDTQALTPIKPARQSEVGDWIALVGAFYQKFPSIYQGILSSTSPDELILNAPVAPGASGGAVVNKKGELIGVIRGRFGFVVGPDYTFQDHSAEILLKSPRSQSKDLCYAIPVKKVFRVTDDLKKYGKIRRGWLGVGLLSAGKRVKVGRVSENSPAERAGIRRGDIILSIDSKSIETPRDVSNIIKSLKPQEKARIKILRHDQEKILAANIGEAKERDYRVSVFSSTEDQPFFYSWSQADTESLLPERLESLPSIENYVLNLSGSRTLGVDVMALTPELAEEFKVKEGCGLLISKIFEDSAAQEAGLQVADIIVQANDNKTITISDLRKVLNQLKDEETILLTLYQKGKVKKIKVIPDKNKRWGPAADEFTNKLRELNIKIDESRAKKLKERIEVYGEREKSDQELLNNYILQIERMKKDQERLNKEIKRLRELLETEKKDRKRATL